MHSNTYPRCWKVLSAIALLILVHQIELSCSTSPCITQLDLVVAVDTSSSCSQKQFDRLLSEVKALVSKFPIGPTKTRLALIGMSQTAQVLANFDDVTSLSDFNSAVDRLTMSSERAEISKGIKLARESVLNKARAAPTPRLLALVKDRQCAERITGSSDAELASIESEVAAARSMESAVHAVGIGGLWNSKELKAVFGTNFLLFKNTNKAMESIKSLNYKMCLPTTCKHSGRTNKREACIGWGLQEFTFNVAAALTSSGMGVCRQQIERSLVECGREDLLQNGAKHRLMQDDGNLNIMETQCSSEKVKREKKKSGHSGTHTHQAIDKIRNILQSKGRPNVLKAVIIITDGGSGDETATWKAATNIKKVGVTLYAVGVEGKRDIGTRAINKDELEMMTAPESDKNVFILDDIKKMKHWAKNFSERLCMELEPPSPKLCDADVEIKSLKSNCRVEKIQTATVNFKYDTAKKCIKHFRAEILEGCKTICVDPIDGSDHLEGETWTNMCHEFRCLSRKTILPTTQKQQSTLPTTVKKCVAADFSCKPIGAAPFRCRNIDGEERENCQCIDKDGEAVLLGLSTTSMASPSLSMHWQFSLSSPSMFLQRNGAAPIGLQLKSAATHSGMGECGWQDCIAAPIAAELVAHVGPKLAFQVVAAVNRVDASGLCPIFIDLISSLAEFVIVRYFDLTVEDWSSIIITSPTWTEMNLAICCLQTPTPDAVKAPATFTVILKLVQIYLSHLFHNPPIPTACTALSIDRAAATSDSIEASSASLDPVILSAHCPSFTRAKSLGVGAALALLSTDSRASLMPFEISARSELIPVDRGVEVRQRRHVVEVGENLRSLRMPIRASRVFVGPIGNLETKAFTSESSLSNCTNEAKASI
uniref:VWFA domain-containing protein n=1 Tax=Macrostomum lignano TaxID=282301 RepID=A0A1I8GX45_9PLAT